MAIHQNDLAELKRILTNAHAEDKARMNRVIKGISDLNNEINVLKVENEKLRKDLKECCK